MSKSKSIARKQAAARGRNDFNRNKPLGASPYRNKTLHRDWLSGWLRGMREMTA